MIRGCDVDVSAKSIECSVVFSGTIGIWSNLFFYSNHNKWFTGMGADISVSGKLKIG